MAHGTDRRQSDRRHQVIQPEVERRREERRCCKVTDKIVADFLVKEGTRLGKSFLAWCDRHGICAADAKDAIQDFLVRLVERIRAGTATPADLVIPRVFLCGKRSAIRKHLRSVRVLPSSETPINGHSNEVHAAMLAAIPDALARLSEEDRDIITLCDLEGQNQETLAEKWGVHQGTVSRRLKLARHHLGEEIVSILVKEGFEVLLP